MFKEYLKTLFNDYIVKYNKNDNYINDVILYNNILLYSLKNPNTQFEKIYNLYKKENYSLTGGFDFNRASQRLKQITEEISKNIKTHNMMNDLSSSINKNVLLKIVEYIDELNKIAQDEKLKTTVDQLKKIKDVIDTY